MHDDDPNGSALPPIDAATAASIAERDWGLRGPTRKLGSNQDYNLRIDDARGPVVLKIANPVWERSAIEAQRDALLAVAAAGIAAPAPVGDLRTVEIGGVRLLAHVVSYVVGDPLLDRATFGIAECRMLGETAGRLVDALADYAHPGTDRDSPWDLRVATEVIGRTDPALLARLAEARARLEALVPDLPTQVIHGDVTDDNVVLTAAGEAAVIDFGDLATSWRCAELAVTVASVLGKTSDDVAAVLAVVEAFGDRVRLSDAELTAIWPLVVLRTGVLVACDAELVTAGNAYASARSASETRALETALELDADEMAWLIRGVGQPLAELSLRQVLPAVEPVDLGVTSEVWNDGAWLEPRPWNDRIPRSGGDRAPASRYGEYRLDRARVWSPAGSATVFSLGIEVVLPRGSRLPALPAGVVADGLDADNVVIAPTVWLQACALPGTPPRYVTARAEEVWRRICPDPSPLAGVEVAAPAPDPGTLLTRRDAHLARVQEHYFDRPPQIERGWREFLIDTSANVYLDVVNNVATTGHAHPDLTRAATRQWSLLNTNSRFHYEAHVALSERLAALAPEGLDQVFLVNSGSEAVDLALRLAMTATGRSRILAAREAYHGWTLGSDAVTSSIGDNPRALETRPAWVELMDAANQVRGRHRGPGAAAAYLADLDAQLAGLDTAEIAGVILEPIFGNGGGVHLPEGYLAGVYRRVRAIGGVCISDEVQVGYGRTGHHFWGFEQQHVVPDIITIAKSMGNGQPLGAVITTRALAEAFSADGSFFSSAGGSPVSSAIGLAVLDVMEREQLQENARTVGDHFKAGLERLAGKHDVIGAVHGSGLYLGVELVTDRESLAPATVLAAQVCDALLAQGCLVQPTGDRYNVLKIKPPLVITATSVDFALDALDRVLTRLTR
ncbi:MAG: aminotransferase class III-fold pyridoxal phosphate-dependent enzyme [Nocardioides sp.]|uniref:aminotransferase class III-fold pyridoxal phosphate-dependent enzyme n=1 Tax=Nocardioides sp. TaxID=35761 RepID=UPI0039E5F447